MSCREVAPADPEYCPTAADEADGRLARDDPLDGRTDCRWSSRSLRWPGWPVPVVFRCCGRKP